jgi:hypothetical protein
MVTSAINLASFMLSPEKNRPENDWKPFTRGGGLDFENTPLLF